MRIRRIALTVAGIAVATLAACQSTAPRDSSPGALPRSKSGASAQINSATYTAHGELLERRGDFERAADQYRLALALNPDSLEARNRLGVTLNKLGKHAEASEEFRKAVTQHPNLPYLYNNLGFSLYLEERYAEAEPAFARCLQLQPTFRRARMNHGLVLGKLGRYDESFGAFAQAGSTADAHYNVAILEAEAGHYVDAARSLEAALHSQPDFPAARDQLREISRLAAAEEAAEQAAREAAALAEALHAATTTEATTPDETPLATETPAVAVATEPEPPSLITAPEMTPPTPAADEPPAAAYAVVADVESATPPAVPETRTRDPRLAARLDRIYAEIECLISAEREVDAAPLPALNSDPYVLLEMFETLLSESAINEPAANVRLLVLERLLGLQDEQ